MRSVPLRLLVAAALLAAGAGAPRAAKLAVFHNGRVLQVEDVRHEDGWYYLTLGRSSRLGVPETLIAEIREADKEVGPSLPNVQASAGGAGSAGARPVTGAPMARPSAAGRRLPSGGAMTQEEARQRAEELAQRGRTLGGDLQNLRRSAEERSDDSRKPTPGGIDLTGNQSTWPSPFRQERSNSRGGRRGQTAPDETTPDETDPAAEEDDDN